MGVNYYPFGWAMPGRKSNTGEMRFGFNGQEQDTEWRGGQAVNFKFRVHDPRIGRFLSFDPLAPEYPWYTPYQFAGNTSIEANELEGLEPNSQNGQLENNFVFDFGESGLNESDQQQFMQDFQNDLNTTFGQLTQGGNQVGTNGSIFTTNPNDDNLTNRDNFNVFVHSGSGVANAGRDDNGVPFMNLYAGSDWNQESGMINNVAAHEYGHPYGNSDRYFEGNMRNSNTRFPKTDRYTFPIVPHKGDALSKADPDYIWSNNLYSSNAEGSGRPLLTPYQQNILFSDAVEPQWDQGLSASFKGNNQNLNMQGYTIGLQLHKNVNISAFEGLTGKKVGFSLNKTLQLRMIELR